MVCDILAGEQGPSCSTVKQNIPDTKLIHVRFIDEIEGEVVEKKTELRHARYSNSP